MVDEDVQRRTGTSVSSFRLGWFIRESCDKTMQFYPFLPIRNHAETEKRQKSQLEVIELKQGEAEASGIVSVWVHFVKSELTRDDHSDSKHTIQCPAVHDVSIETLQRVDVKQREAESLSAVRQVLRQTSNTSLQIGMHARAQKLSSERVDRWPCLGIRQGITRVLLNLNEDTTDGATKLLSFLSMFR